MESLDCVSYLQIYPAAKLSRSDSISFVDFSRFLFMSDLV